MIIRITFKTPDAVDEAIQEAVDRHRRPEHLEDDEWAAVVEQRVEKLKPLSRRWFEYGEYVTVEWNTEDNTCVVIPS